MGNILINDTEFKVLFEASPNLYLVLSPQFIILAASDAYLKATLITRESAVGRNIFDVFPDNPNDPKSNGVSLLKASLERVLKNKAPDDMAIQKYDIPLPSGEGFEERHWSPLNTPVIGPLGDLLYIIHRVEDVTDLVKLKSERIKQFQLTEEIKAEKDVIEKKQQSQRMEAMGALAGGVAHDFNNLLSIILLSCEKVLDRNKLDEEVETDLNRIISSGKKAAALTRQLLAFSRKQVLQPKVLNLNKTVEGIQDLLSRLLKENIQFQTNLTQNIKSILVDQAQVEQVILNLVINARDAMPSGGQILVETSNVTLDEAMASGNLLVEAGSYVMLSVRDTGVGMDANTQARIFEPFFTTKAVDKGTGLGLATVYGIVSQNKGCIWVYSEVNVGTVFKVYFPQHDGPLDATIAPSQSAKDYNKTGTLLVVEDQKPLREVICSALEHDGHKVFSAENGAQALELLVELNDKVDLIITDVIMPVMGGKELNAKLQALGKKIKILFLSGFTDDVLEDSLDQNRGLQFLEKPFSNQALRAKVKNLL